MFLATHSDCKHTCKGNSFCGNPTCVFTFRPADRFTLVKLRPLTTPPITSLLLHCTTNYPWNPPTHVCRPQNFDFPPSRSTIHNSHCRHSVCYHDNVSVTTTTNSCPSVTQCQKIMYIPVFASRVWFSRQPKFFIPVFTPFNARRLYNSPFSLPTQQVTFIYLTPHPSPCPLFFLESQKFSIPDLYRAPYISLITFKF